MELLTAKELFGRSVSTAVATRTCVSCKTKTGKNHFKDSLGSYEEYLQDGLCHICSDELLSPVS